MRIEFVVFEVNLYMNVFSLRVWKEGIENYIKFVDKGDDVDCVFFKVIFF